MKFEKSRDLINAIKASVKQRKVYDGYKKKLNSYVEMPNLDYATKWSFTFEMFWKAFAAKNLLSSVTNSVQNMGEIHIYEARLNENLR